jgi:hypothetical protein
VSGLAAGTPPAGCVHIYSKANKKLYYKDDTGTEYELGTGGGSSGLLLQIDYITLTSTDILNKEITLSKTPAQADMTIWDIISGSAQVYSDDFTVTGNALSWDGKDPETFLQAGDTCRILYVYQVTDVELQVEYITFDSTMITNKEVQLQNIPADAAEVTWTIISGSEQVYLDDFTITSSTLSWAGKPLDGILAVGDSCRIAYTYTP